MRSSTDATTDKAMLDYVRTSGNKIKGRCIDLLQGEDEERLTFKSDISSFQYQLERVHIPSNQRSEVERLSFREILIDENKQLKEIKTDRGVEYKAERFDSGGAKGQVETIVFSLTKNETIFQHRQNKFHLSELEQHTDFVKLSPNKQTNTRACYKTIDPRKPVNLLAPVNGDILKIGSYEFVNDPELVFKGLIEALYCVRNALFHGHVVPDEEANKLYGAAYRVLKKLIDYL